MIEPLVSVIIPCYNVEDYVQEAIISILKQSYTKLEVWIIDDASTDDTLSRINKIEDPRITVVPFKFNTQKIGAVNEVLQKVTGQYICFQDADDWSEQDRILNQLEQFNYHPGLGICFTSYRLINSKISLPDKISFTNEELQNEFLEFGNKRENLWPTVCGTMMISKEVLERTRGYHPYFTGRVGEDIHWIYRILKEFKGVTLDKIMYNYRVREGSFTQISSSGKNAKYLYSCELLSKIIYKDIHENINVLNPLNVDKLRLIELEACEKKLLETISILNETRNVYENSLSFKLGKFILSPWHFFKFKKGNPARQK